MKLAIRIVLGRKTVTTAYRQIQEKLTARKRGTIVASAYIEASNAMELTIETLLDAAQIKQDLNAALRRNKTTTAYVASCEQIVRTPKLLLLTRETLPVALAVTQQRAKVFNGLHL